VRWRWTRISFGRREPCDSIPAGAGNTRALAGILVAQYRDDYSVLLRHASERVRRCWRLHEWRRRAEHDPIWLGVQVTDTYEELAGEVAADA
jgi:glycine/D-amino acid oxidase-like deaminating enzyme